jgi:cytochrome c
MPLNSHAQQRLGLGQHLSDDALAGWDIDIAAVLYAEKCQACHGEKGVGGPANKLAGGAGTLNSTAPLKSIGSFWPYASTLFDYIRRAMPLNAPQSLNPDQVYALSAYLLFLNGIVEASQTIDSTNLPKLKMPNSQGFKPVIDSLPQ